MEKRKIIINETFGKPFLVVKSDGDGGWKERGKSYDIRSITGLIGGERNYCLYHDEKVAERLREGWAKMLQKNNVDMSNQGLKEKL